MTTVDILKSTHKQLSKEEIDRFLNDGYVVVRDVFPKEIANRVLPLISAELKLDMNDPSTWPKHLVTLQKIFQKKKVITIPTDLLKFTPVVVLRKELETELIDKIYTERYNGIIDDLCGHGRWKTKKGIGHWPILFPLFKEQSWQPLEGGWHLDGDFERLNLTSGDWGLILMHLFTDIHLGGGGTAVRLGSHRYTAQILAEAGSSGLLREELIPRVIAATRHLPVKELTGNNGDLFIMHPWIIHSSSLNTSDQFRIAANKHIALHSPMNFKRNKLSDYSLVELAVLDSIARNGKNFPSKNIETNEAKKEECIQPKQQSLLKILKGMNLPSYINAKDLVRISVLHSNSYWPFSKLNKIPYELALKAFVNHCSKYPEINSVYLRRTLKNGSWTPALSDIDLTVISKKNLTPEREFDFLSSFWRKFGQLKKLYPMYGEIYIINEGDFGLWKQLEFEGSNVENWILLSGNEVPRNNLSINKNRFQLEAFNLAFSFYLNHFLDLFNRKGMFSHLISSDLFRVRNKIMKCLNGYIPEPSINGHYKSIIKPNIELLINVVTELKDSLTNNPTISSHEITKKWQNEVKEKNNLIVDDEAVDMKKLLQWHDHIQCVYINFTKKIFIILKDGLDQQTFDNCIKAVARAFSNENHLPVILNVTLFKYFLCHYKPFEYGHFISYRTLAFGTDILLDITPPDKTAIGNQLIKETAEILKFPLSRKFIVSAGKSDSVAEFAHIFDTALMTKYYLEHVIISPWYQEFLDSSYKAYPNHVKKLEELQRSKTPYIELFKHYKLLAKEIHGSIITNNKQNLIANENYI